MACVGISKLLRGRQCGQGLKVEGVVLPVAEIGCATFFVELNGAPQARAQLERGLGDLAGASLERELGLEVGVVAVRERDRALALQQRDEALDQLAVELAVPATRRSSVIASWGVIGER